MEACTVKPEVKKKQKQPKPPLKPTEIKRNDPERWEKPTPLVPQRPTDAELIPTQFRMKRAANFEVYGGMTQTPVVPPRPSEKELKVTSRYSHHRRSKSDVPDVEADVKQSDPLVNDGAFRRSLKEKTPSFTSYVTHNMPTDRTDDVPVKQTSGSKPASREPSPDPSAEEAGSEKEKSAEKNKPDKNAEPKQDIGGMIAGMFRKTPKEKSSSSSSSPAVTVSKADSGSEDEEESGDEEKGGFLSGIRKSLKTHETPAQDNLSVHGELSASNDSLSDNSNKKEKGGVFSGIFKRMSSEADQLSLNDDPSDSNDNPSENSKEKGGFFSGILRKSPKIPAEGTPEQDKQTKPHDSNETENNATKQEKGGAFAGRLKKSPKLEEGAESLRGDLSASTDSLSENKEKGGLFSGLLRKTPKTSAEENLSAQKNLSASNDSLTEVTSTKEKGGGAFSGLFKKSPRLVDSPPTDEESQSQDDELSGSREALNAKEKGGIFSGIFKKSPKPADAAQPEEDESPEADLSTSTENLSENKPEKAGGLFGVRLKKTPKPSKDWTESPDESPEADLSTSTENLSENKPEKAGGLFGVRLKKTPKASKDWTESPEREAQEELSASNDDLAESDTAKEKNIFSNMFRKPQKPAEDTAADKELEENTERRVSGSCENLSVPKEKKGGLAGIFKRSSSIDNLFDEEKGGLFSGLMKKTPKASADEVAAEDNDEQKELSASNDNLFENSNTKERSIFSAMFKKTPKPAEGTTTDEESSDDKKLYGSRENLLDAHTTKEKSGGLAGIFKKSPKLAPRSIATQDPLKETKDLYASCDSLPETTEDFPSAISGEMSASNDNLSEATSTPKEKKTGFSNMFKKTPKTQQDSEDVKEPEGGGLRRRRTIRKKKRVVSFRVKKTLPKMSKLNLTSQSSHMVPLVEETFELQELNPTQESNVEVEAVEMAAYPTEENPLTPEQESDDDLMEWWNTVKGWAEWNELHLQDGDEQMAMEQAADRVYMAARLFVRLFNRRGAALQHRILELLALADAADEFHKKTVKAAVGGGVASVAGSIATITGLILAPFTFGASIIVTAVGIGVATAGSITSATANITDTVHSNMDRKKLEKMIQSYQEEISDIRQCLEFVQAGMDTLQEWDFEKYSESAAKKAMNHNLKHVMKEGGRAGKALMINTDKLISTVQVLGAAGGAAKAVQAISVTTGVMSALFLALDVFFLAKDSHELRKGAKTKFATKIRDVCKELQDGLLELNKVKTQLQKTMDGIEVEEYEEIKEVEEEVDDEYESDPKKLAELEQELDLLEEKLDKKVEEEQKKSIEIEKEMLEKKEKEETEDAQTEGKNENKKGKSESERKISGEEKETKNEAVKAAKEEVLKEPPKGKKDKDAENQITAGKEKHESERDKAKEDNGADKKTLVSRTGDSKREEQSGNSRYESGKTERESSRRSSREDESEMKPDWRKVDKETEAEGASTRHGGSRSDKGRHHGSERGSKHETRESDRTQSWRRREEEEGQTGAKDWRAEMAKGREKRKEEGRDGTRREDRGESDESRKSHRSEEAAPRKERPESERGGSRREESDSQRSRHRRGGALRDGDDEEKRGSRMESARRRFERAEGEGGEEKGTRKEDAERRGGDRERRGSNREHEHGRHRSQRTSKAMLEDGLNI
ncbi:myb-like protein X isoform X2 [Clinocottus analis]|uniref:myb-like protein X isoform X2 n=1 Tax=Clinocottus analis TaxID=304258 RepID=UPI0035BED6DF